MATIIFTPTRFMIGLLLVSFLMLATLSPGRVMSVDASTRVLLEILPLTTLSVLIRSRAPAADLPVQPVRSVTAECTGKDDTPALTAAVNTANGGWVVIKSGDICATRTLTIPNLRIETGGMLKPATNQTVTISSQFDAGNYQVFANALPGQGHVSFLGNSSVREFNAAWWGASGTGVADEHINIQAANDAMPAAGGVLSLQSGVFAIAAPINLGQFVILRGTGYQGTEIRALPAFRGAAMIQNKFQDGSQQMAAIEAVLVNGNKASGANVSAGILLKVIGQVSHVRDVYITSCSGNGLVLNGGGDTDGNHLGSAGYYINNVSVDASNDHNIVITGQIQAVSLDTVTSQFMAAGKAGILLEGTGREGRAGIWLRNIHLEGNPSSEVLNAVGIDINNMNSVIVDGANYIGANARTGDMVRIRGTSTDVTLRTLRSQSLLNIINDTTNGRSFRTANSPYVAYYSSGDIYANSINSMGSLRLGDGTPLTKFMVYVQNLAPAAIGPHSSFEQDFTVSGLTPADKVIVNGPATNPGTGIVNARVKNNNTLSLTFANFDEKPLTPAAGAYSIIAIRN
jgi:hypothetical protein